MPLFAIPDDKLIFPDPLKSMADGLLGVGGDLSVERLMLAYQNGIFPWYGEDGPILWWSPPERCVIFPEKLHVSKSMQKVLKRHLFDFTIDSAFEEVILACANTPRKDQDGTWITEEMIEAYVRLYHSGHAHSAEMWQDGILVGGVYGIRTGHVFCGESMFSDVTNASKAALIQFVRHLQQTGITLFDCQNHTSHLESLGAVMISRTQYLELLHNTA